VADPYRDRKPDHRENGGAALRLDALTHQLAAALSSYNAEEDLQAAVLAALGETPAVREFYFVGAEGRVSFIDLYLPEDRIGIECKLDPRRRDQCWLSEGTALTREPKTLYQPAEEFGD
jgi:hypothetical protein